MKEGVILTQDIRDSGENKKNRLRLWVLLLTVALLIFAALYKRGMFGSGNASEMQSTKYDFAMGTAVSVTIYGGESPESIADNIVDDIKSLDADVISWRDEGSELASVNALPAGEEFAVSDVLFEAVNESLNICEDSGGALDITLRPLLDCWNIENATEENFSVPDKKAIQESLAKTGYKKLSLHGNDDGATIEKSDAVTIDLGATGKGYALDVVRSYLDEKEVSGAIITAGGSVMVYGDKSTGESWKVGIRNPDGSAEDMIGYLEISDVDYMCVSTSGDYEKYVDYEGKRYHHILDSATGYPAQSGLSSVTVMCKSGIDSDGLSTACFVLGEEKSRSLLEKYDAGAVFIDTDGNVTMTENMKEFYREN
jgi:thiamine biosynthesis lipoprotein